MVNACFLSHTTDRKRRREVYDFHITTSEHAQEGLKSLWPGLNICVSSIFSCDYKSVTVNILAFLHQYSLITDS